MEFFLWQGPLAAETEANNDADDLHTLRILNGIFLMARSSSGKMPKLMMTLSLVKKTTSTP